jgi:ABC-type multidrug transport system ATPase subunit
MGIDKFTLDVGTPFGRISSTPITLGPSGKQPIFDKLALIMSDFDKAYETSNMPEAARCLSELCRLVKPSQALDAQTVVKDMREHLQQRRRLPLQGSKQRRLFELSREHAYQLRVIVSEETLRPAPKYQDVYTHSGSPAQPLAIDQTSIVQMHQASFGYRNRQVLKEVNLVVRPGDIVGVFGENGSGKSTLLRAMAGDLATTFGSIHYPLLDAASHSKSEKFDRIAFVDMRSDATAPPYSVIRYLRFYAALRGIARNDESEVDEVRSRLARVGLQHREDVDVGDLSAGEAARLEFAKLLVSPPQLLLLDEPLGPLDAAGKRTLATELGELIRNGDLPSALVMTTQDDLILELISTRVVMVREGRIEEAKSVDRVREGSKRSGSVWYEIAFKNAREQLGTIRSFLNTVKALAYDIDGMPMRFSADRDLSMSSLIEVAQRLNLDVVYLRDLSMSPTSPEPESSA